jgi:hypothetical protein
LYVLELKHAKPNCKAAPDAPRRSEKSGTGNSSPDINKHAIPARTLQAAAATGNVAEICKSSLTMARGRALDVDNEQVSFIIMLSKVSRIELGYDLGVVLRV